MKITLLPNKSWASPFAGLGARLGSLLPALLRPLPAPGARVANLETRHSVLQEQLRELEASSSRRPPEVVAAERKVLEAAAATVSSELEYQRSVTPPVDRLPVAPLDAGRRARRGVAAGVATVVLVSGLALASGVLRGAPRAASKPGDSALGTASPHGQTPLSAGHPALDVFAEPSPQEAATRATLEKNPDDLEARLELARLRLDQNDYMATWDETERILASSPDNPRALAYQSQVRLAMGQPQVALDMLHRALAKDPLLLQAYIYQSHVQLLLNQDKEAAATIAEAKRRYPNQAAWLDTGFEVMEAEVKTFGAPTLAPGNDPHAGLGQNPHEAAAPGAQAVSPHGRVSSGRDPELAALVAPGVSGTVELDAPLQAALPPGAVVFLVAREAGVGAGPPVAAKRLAGTFPQLFELGVADSMQGNKLPSHLLLEARVDTDGDASTQEPADPKARLDDVAIGTSKIRLVLRKPN